jgi:hypothetical protein
MKPNVSTLERAFEPADSGLFSTVAAIKIKLAREGYRHELIEGSELVKQLVAAMTKASHRPATARRSHSKRKGGVSPPVD